MFTRRIPWSSVPAGTAVLDNNPDTLLPDCTELTVDYGAVLIFGSTTVEVGTTQIQGSVAVLGSDGATVIGQCIGKEITETRGKFNCNSLKGRYIKWSFTNSVSIAETWAQARFRPLGKVSTISHASFQLHCLRSTASTDDYER